MAERRGEWPTWIMAAGCGGAFVCGLFVAWAVFAEPARAEQTSVEAREPKPADQSELLARIEALQTEMNSHREHAESFEKKVRQGMLETSILKTRLFSVVDHDGKDRIVMGTVFGEASISIQRPNGESALVLKEDKGAVSIAFVDQNKQPRLTIAVANDHSQIDLLDAKKQNRARLVVTPNGDGNIGVIDAKGQPRVGLIAGETFNGVMLFDEKGNATALR